MKIQSVNVIISCAKNQNLTKGKIHTTTWNPQERGLRALKFLGLCWLGAGFAILIPGLHFILVPSLFFLGPFVFYRIYQQQSIVTGGEGTCPSCSKPLPIEGGLNRFPFTDLCALCQTSLLIDEDAPSDWYLKPGNQMKPGFLVWLWTQS